MWPGNFSKGRVASVPVDHSEGGMASFLIIHEGVVSLCLWPKRISSIFVCQSKRGVASDPVRLDEGCIYYKESMTCYSLCRRHGLHVTLDKDGVIIVLVVLDLCQFQ